MAMDSLSTKRISYHQRLFLWLLGYSLVMVGCFVFFQYHREKDFKAIEIDSQLQIINNFIISELDDGTDISKVPLADFHTFDSLRVSLIDKDGYIIYDNTLATLPKTCHKTRDEVLDAMNRGRGCAVRRHSESTGQTYFYSSTLCDNGMVVRTAIPYIVTFNTLLQADYGFMWVMGITTLVMCVLGYFATRRVGLHIIRLNHFAESAEQGVRFSDVEPFPHDELGEISNHIVRLYAELQQAVTDRDREHREALRQQQEKERIKKQLTNNINHELKTPVAAIALCLETLAAHPSLSEDKRAEFINRSLANCDRLKRLLADVSLITRLEDGSSAIETEKLSLTEIVAEVVAEKSQQADIAGIKIVNQFTSQISVLGNQALLLSVFNNLIDNAISYSGGTLININEEPASGDNIVLTLADNGSGVAAEHLPRLFERFYRIDKGRSRSAGGTGLGLAIVKNAIAFHGGMISVSNGANGGLTFRIVLKRCDI